MILAVFCHSVCCKRAPALLSEGLDFASAKRHHGKQPEVPAKLWMPLRCFLHILRQVWELVLAVRRQQLSNLQQNCLFLHLHQDFQSPTLLS